MAPRGYDEEEDYPEETHRPRKPKQRAAPESEGDEEPRKKSKKPSQALVKRDKKADKKVSKKKRRDDRDSESEEEMMLTKTVRKKALTYDEVDIGMIELMCDVFGVKPGKVNKWCDDDLIKWDKQSNEYDIKKVLDKQDDDDVKRFGKQYAKYKDHWQAPADKPGPSGSRGPPVIIDNRPIIWDIGYNGYGHGRRPDSDVEGYHYHIY